MFCKKCGKQLKDGVLFCTYCGEKVVTPGPSQEGRAEKPKEKARLAKIPVQEWEESEASGSRLPILIIGILAVVIIALVLVYFLRTKDSGNWREEERDSSAVREEEEDLPEEDLQDSGEEPAKQEETEEESPKEPEAEEPAVEERAEEEGIHTYELIASDVTWQEAYEDCLMRGGHLVRINSEEEYQAILQKIREEEKQNIKFWLGGRRASADSREYRWVYEDGSYGEEILNQDGKYTSYWLSGEPSYEGETPDNPEMYMNMFYMSREERFVWNDVPEDILAVVSSYAGTIGYICEYDD